MLTENAIKEKIVMKLRVKQDITGGEREVIGAEDLKERKEHREKDGLGDSSSEQ